MQPTVACTLPRLFSFLCPLRLIIPIASVVAPFTYCQLRNLCTNKLLHLIAVNRYSLALVAVLPQHS